MQGTARVRTQHQRRLGEREGEGTKEGIGRWGRGKAHGGAEEQVGGRLSRMKKAGGRGIVQSAYFLPRTLLLHLIGDRRTFCPVRGTGQCVGRLVIASMDDTGGQDDTAAVLRAFSSPAPWARGLSGSRWPSAPHLGKREIMVGFDCPRGGLWMGPSTCLLRRGGRDEAGQRVGPSRMQAAMGVSLGRCSSQLVMSLLTGWRGFAGELKNSLAEGPEITGTNEKGMAECALGGVWQNTPTRHGSQRRSR